MSYPDPLHEDELDGRQFDQAPPGFDFSRLYERSGGQAFPSFELQPDGRHTYPVHGMTKRDYFAAAALTGLVHEDPYYDQVKLAKRAYQIADAMVFMSGEEVF